jgi:hypothetical protein
MKSFLRFVRRAFCHSEERSDEAIDAFVFASLNAIAFRLAISYLLKEL